VRRPVYAPALVAWVGGPRLSVSIGIGAVAAPAVGWLPLAPREVYVPTYRVSPRYVREVNVTHVTNITNITTIVTNPQAAVGQRDLGNRKFPHAVTVVPTSVLTTRQPVAPAAAQWRNAPAVRDLVHEPSRVTATLAPPVPTPAVRSGDARTGSSRVEPAPAPGPQRTWVPRGQAPVAAPAAPATPDAAGVRRGPDARDGAAPGRMVAAPPSPAAAPNSPATTPPAGVPAEPRVRPQPRERVDGPRGVRPVPQLQPAHPAHPVQPAPPARKAPHPVVQPPAEAPKAQDASRADRARQADPAIREREGHRRDERPMRGSAN
jgi:hypothetical protein